MSSDTPKKPGRRPGRPRKVAAPAPEPEKAALPEPEAALKPIPAPVEEPPPAAPAPTKHEKIVRIAPPPSRMKTADALNGAGGAEMEPPRRPGRRPLVQRTLLDAPSSPSAAPRMMPTSMAPVPGAPPLPQAMRPSAMPATPASRPAPAPEHEPFIPAPKDDGGVMTEAEAERAHEEFEAGLSSDQREQRGTKREQIYEQIKRGELHITALKDMTVTELRKLARSEKIEGIAGMPKQELVFAIIKNRVNQNGLLYGEGCIEVLPDGYGFLRSPKFNYLPCPDDIYISPSQIRRFGMRTGLTISGQIRPPKDNENYFALLRVEAINHEEPEALKDKVLFEDSDAPLPQPASGSRA